jgi:hypothetical protein
VHPITCRNRHCPRCQKQAADAWRRARIGELLAVPYAHLVFTLPHELNALARMHPRFVYETLLGCTAATLTEFAANPRWLGGQAAFTLVLHTWTQDLRLHVHAHALMACGALAADGRWVAPRRSARFLFPVHALSKIFAGKFRAALAVKCRRVHAPRGTRRDHALSALPGALARDRAVRAGPRPAVAAGRIPRCVDDRTTAGTLTKAMPRRPLQTIDRRRCAGRRHLRLRRPGRACSSGGHRPSSSVAAHRCRNIRPIGLSAPCRRPRA